MFKKRKNDLITESTLSGYSAALYSDRKVLTLTLIEEKDKMNDGNNRVCPVERAGGLDNKIRRWIQNPKKLLGPYIEEGMTVLDIGCGPGFFSIDIAQMVGKSGRVIAADLQEGMLQKLRDKIHGTEFEERITPHKCEANKIGVSVDVGFILLSYVVHEIPDEKAFFCEIESILKPDGHILIVEPSFHVSKTEFEETVKNTRGFGFIDNKGPKLLFSRTAVLKKG